MSQSVNKHEELFAATPFGEDNALTAAEIADLAGQNRRSAGTKLNAMCMSEWVRLGLRSKPGRKIHRMTYNYTVHGPTLYFREAPVQEEQT